MNSAHHITNEQLPLQNDLNLVVLVVLVEGVLVLGVDCVPGINSIERLSFL
jgi:hypothetical protein